MTLRTNKTMTMFALTILTTAIFFIDTFVPLEITGSVMYVFVVLVSLWLPYPYAPVITAMVCTALTFSSLAFLPDGSEWGTVVLNPSLAVFAIWATAIFGSRVKQHIRTLEIREERLHADIIERKQAEQPQELQQAILQKIVNGNHSQADILNDLCLHVEHMFPSAFCAILLLDERTGTLKVGAAPSRRETACTILDGIVPGEYAGACGTAVHTRTTVIIEDTETDPRWEPIREAARPLGIKSCWSIPIICEKTRVLGTFAIAHSQFQRPTPQDLQLLETASYLAGITVHRHQTDQNQRKSEERYRDLYESAPLAYFTTGIDGKIISANRQAVELLGGNKADLIGQSVMNLYAPTPHGREKAQRLHEQTQQGKEIVGEELEMQRTDGSHIWVSLTVRLIHDSQGHLIERREIVKEITQRKQTQELQNLQKSALELIVLGEPLSDILNTLCQQVEHMVPLATCSILILDQDEQCLKFRAGPSVPAPLAAALDGMIPGPCAGSCGTATYQGEPVYVSDTATDPLWAHLQDVAKQFHIAACWSYPIITEGKQVLGSLAISLPHPQSPTQSQVQLLETASYLAGISIQRRNTEQAITDSEQRYRALYEDNPSM